jgi:hypothetical protein
MPAPLIVGGMVRYFIGPMVTAIATLLRSKWGTWVVLALTYLGVGFATQELVLGPILTQITNYAALPGGGDFAVAALQTMGILKVDIAITMLTGAMLTRQAVGAARLFFVKK